MELSETLRPVGDTPQYMCDPPEGWKYGFPRVFNIKKNMTFAMWLRQYGYPERMIPLALGHSRFYTIPEE